MKIVFLLLALICAALSIVIPTIVGKYEYVLNMSILFCALVLWGIAELKYSEQ